MNNFYKYDKYIVMIMWLYLAAHIVAKLIK